VTAPVPFSFDQHCDAIRYAVEQLCGAAASAGLEAPVPTCPGWSVRDLLAHLGMVHRWATAHLAGDRAAQEAGAAAAAEAEGRAVADPVAWLRDGAGALITAMLDAPADLDAFVFLKNAPPPREFWARRQCHETTIHAVDGLSAARGRVPTAQEAAAQVGVSAALALDGIDELLTGFLPRRSSRLRADQPLRLAVRPDDSDLAWLVEVGEEPPVTTRHTAASPADADATFSGTSVELYLGLWNRGEELVADDAQVLRRWREAVRVSWS
jgi:uncharacterized protein (TIGR03083 family)